MSQLVVGNENRNLTISFNFPFTHSIAPSRNCFFYLCGNKKKCDDDNKYRERDNESILMS